MNEEEEEERREPCASPFPHCSSGSSAEALHSRQGPLLGASRPDPLGARAQLCPDLDGLLGGNHAHHQDALDPALPQRACFLKGTNSPSSSSYPLPTSHSPCLLPYHSYSRCLLPHSFQVPTLAPLNASGRERRLSAAPVLGSRRDVRESKGEGKEEKEKKEASMTTEELLNMLGPVRSLPLFLSCVPLILYQDDGAWDSDDEDVIKLLSPRPGGDVRLLSFYFFSLI